MARMQCGSCGGTYETEQPGGFRYFHACAPSMDPDTLEIVERADKRDENVVVTRDAKGVMTGTAKSDGKGTVDVVER